MSRNVKRDNSGGSGSKIDCCPNYFFFLMLDLYIPTYHHMTYSGVQWERIIPFTH